LKSMPSGLKAPSATNFVLIGTSLRDLPVQRHFAALGRELVASGYQVALLIHGPADEAIDVDSRISVMRWPSPRPTSFADALFFDRLVRRLKPCCVISNFGAMAIMMTIGGFRRVPVRIHWHHTLSSQIEADWGGIRMSLRFLRLRARIPFRFATHAIANSEAARQDLIQNYGVPALKCQIFWNSLADPLSQSALSSSPRAISLNSRRFVCAGRFAASKGQDVLVKAMARVVRTHPEVTVDFMGDGSTRVACEELARELGVADRCRFVGLVTHPEVLSRMAGARASVVPSRQEAFGLVNIESMSLGLPVIGSNTGGIAEIVRDGMDGFLFPPGDHAALARHMIRLIEDGPLRAQIAASARRRFLEHFESAHAVKMQVPWIIEQITHAANVS
jgi:glycosyltransferase involved in cell wall biosynthesis